jgi:1,4-dihydroxy-2-naphthoyl-CoA hydrolase
MPEQSDHPASPAPPALSVPSAPSVLPVPSWIGDLGLVVDELSATRVVAHLDLDERHHTPFGVVHGGVYATVVESLASMGASSAVADRGQFAVGVNNSTDFIRAATGGRVDAVAEPVQQGRVQQLWDVTVRAAADGRIVAQGRLRLQNVALPTS